MSAGTAGECRWGQPETELTAPAYSDPSPCGPGLFEWHEQFHEALVSFLATTAVEARGQNKTATAYALWVPLP